MNLCTCPRCAFFTLIATFAMEDGDIKTALTMIGEVTVLDEDGQVAFPPMSEIARQNDEGYTDVWRDVAPSDGVPETMN